MKKAILALLLFISIAVLFTACEETAASERQQKTYYSNTNGGLPVSSASTTTAVTYCANTKAS